MLDRAGDEVSASSRLERFGRAADREIVRFGPAAREDYFGRFGADERRDGAASVIQDRLRPLPVLMNARWIAEIFL